MGGGLSGLTAALDLARKGYQVVLFEAEDRLGGSLRAFSEDELPGNTLEQDLKAFEGLTVDFRLGTRVGLDVSVSDLERSFGAIYLGKGRGPGSPIDVEKEESGRLVVDELTFQTNTSGVFAGGSAISRTEVRSPVGSISDGRRAAISIDRFMQKVSLTASRDLEGAYETRLFTDTTGIEPLYRVSASGPAHGYSRQEARAEASRCLQCECMECVKVCKFLEEFKGYPRKYIRQVYNNLSIVMGQRHGNRFINSCSFCGLCKEVCPESLNMADVCKPARVIMVDQGKMPPSAHEFALREMEFSNSDKAALVRHQAGAKSSEYLFFPGCQLSGSSPEHVKKAYEYLTNKLAGRTGLMLGCCGAPADWAGRTEAVTRIIGEFKGQWSDMGSPRLILACSSCYQVFKAHLPEAPLVPLWELIDQRGLSDSIHAAQHQTLAIHDPCTTRHEGPIQQSVRSILHKLGYGVQELALSGEKTECCGFGGLMYFANRELADKVIHERISRTDLELLAYCAVCRDHFTSHGKPTRHLLDLIFPENAVENVSAAPPTIPNGGKIESD